MILHVLGVISVCVICDLYVSVLVLGVICIQPDCDLCVCWV